MKIVDLPISQLLEATWNPNHTDDATRGRLKASLTRYGMVGPLVVRPMEKETYEVLSGNQRLQVLQEMGVETAPCVIVGLDDAHARLLAQALNHIHGEDDLGLRAELLRKVLASLPEHEVLAVLPETAESLQGLASLGQDELAKRLEAWQAAQEARLRHLQFQFSVSQMETVEEALERAMVGASTDGSNPNKRGNALFSICRAYLKQGSV